MGNLAFTGIEPTQAVSPNQFGLSDSMSQLALSMGTPAGTTPGMATAAVSTMGGAAPAGAAAPTVDVQAPDVGAGGGFWGGLGGWNMDTAKLALGGLQTLGNLWMGARALKMAKEQFNYQKGVTETNLVNSIQSYNTALQDRANNRADATNSSQASADAYVEANKAVRQ
jgi:hypothetical protein